MLLENAAQPDIARRLEVRSADPFADQIFRRLDAGVEIHEGEAVTKATVKKYRNRRQRVAVIARHEIAADIELADIEFLIARHAPVALARAVAGQHHEIETVRFHRAFFQRADDLIIAHRDR